MEEYEQVNQEPHLRPVWSGRKGVIFATKCLKFTGFNSVCDIWSQLQSVGISIILTSGEMSFFFCHISAEIKVDFTVAYSVEDVGKLERSREFLAQL